MRLRTLSIPAALLGGIAIAGCSADRALTPSTATIGGPSALVADASDADAAVAGNYLVRFKGNGIPKDFAATVASLGGEVIFAHDGVGIAAVSGLDDARADQLAARSDVQAVDADAYTTLEGPGDEQIESFEGFGDDTPASASNPARAALFPWQWNMRAISADSAWRAGKLGKSTTRVGILDTGIDYLSADLYGRVDLNASRSFLSAAENKRVQTYFPGAHPIADLNFHGTHVAATVASNGRVGAGVTSGITLVGLKVCTPGTAPNYEGSCPSSGTLAAILYAADIGLDVINMSLGGAFTRRAASARGGDGPSFLATINRVMNYANRKGTLVVVAAGNSAFNLDQNIIPLADGSTAHVPGLYASYCDAAAVVCVSATGPTKAAALAGPYENIDAPAFYSNYGRSAISVAAPGGNGDPVARKFVYVYAVCSGFIIDPRNAGCRTRTFNPATGAWSSRVIGALGTSMAAPHVTGIAALIAGEVGHNPGLIRARLQQSADDLGEPGTDPAYGKGRVNAARAVGL